MVTLWVGVGKPPPKEIIFGTCGSRSLQRHIRLVMRLHEQPPSSTSRSKPASRSRPTFHIFAQNDKKCSKFSAGAPRRHERGIRPIGAPLLQFWHHGVTDLSAKPSKSSRAKAKTLKGFQRDWWNRAPSVLYCVSKLFATLAEKCLLWHHEGFPCSCTKILGWRLVPLVVVVGRPPPKRDHIWNLWLPISSKTHSFGDEAS